MDDAVCADVLRREMAAERLAHEATMAELTEQASRVRAMLAERQTALTDLITCVTTLRMAKAEQPASSSSTSAEDKETTAGATAAVPNAFHTGSDVVDRALQVIQGRLEKLLDVVGETGVLRELETAALEALTPYGPGRLSAVFTSNAAATRTTGVLLVFLPDVRGVRSWARQHTSRCTACAARQARVPPWTPYRHDSKLAGFAAAPALRSIPNKRYHRLVLTLQQERSIADRVDAEEGLEVLRVTAQLRVQSSATGQPLSDTASVCADMTRSLRAFVVAATAELRRTLRTSAPWSTGDNPNGELSAAVEVLLHMIRPRVEVRVPPPTPLPAPAMAASGVAPLDTHVQVEVAIGVPLQVSAVAPLLQLLSDPVQRAYVEQHVLTPLAHRIGDALGIVDLAVHYTSVGQRLAQSLYQMVVSTAPSTAAAAGAAAAADSTDAVRGQLYLVLQALAAFGTSVEVEVATPPLDTDAAAHPARRAAVAVQRLASALLRQCAAPMPLQTPPSDDPDAATMSVKVARIPTRFLEIVNGVFSSTERLPRAARGGVLDTFISPKTKVSLALRLFKELVVDVYRPYHPCTGVVLASENGVGGGRPRAPPCTPVVDMPASVAAANIELADCVDRHLRQMEEATSSPSSLSSQRLVQVSQAALTCISAAAAEVAPLQQLREEWAAAQVRVVDATVVSVMVVLPFDMTTTDVRHATKPLLYLRLQYSK